MSKLIDKYQTLRAKIIERAIHINDMLHALELPDELDGYRLPYCGLKVKELHNSSIDEYSVDLIYSAPYEDYDETWTITASYIDMEDEDIVKDFIERTHIQYGRDKQLRFDLLKRDAEYFGYELVEKKGDFK